MNTLQVIDELQSYADNSWGGLNEAFEAAISALEKQVSKRPDLEGDGYDDNGELIYDTGYCPNCRHEFEVYYDATKYCPNCGQHLDWSEIEDLSI